MASRLSPYNPPTPIRSALLKNAPDAVPPTDELEQLHAELKQLKQRTMDRARKAGEDLKTIEESYRRMKEREKGKAKATDRVKRERDFTPGLDVDESRLATGLTRSRLSSQHVPSVAPSSARSSLDPRRPPLEDPKKKKKKRKREMDDSEGENDSQRPRKATTPVPPVPHLPPQKAPKVTPVVSQTHVKPQTGPDFSAPPSYPLLPSRPPVPPPPIAGPSKPTEVAEDFSKLKPPTQILVTSFYSSIEPWIRGIREEDVGFLEYTGDEVEPYIMPKLGRHYLEVWEDQDSGLVPGGALAEPMPGSTSFAAPVPKWDPSTLMEPDLLTEDRGHGPLTERVISALLPMPDLTVWKGVKAAEDAMEGRPGGSGAAAARREKMNVSDLEIRIRDSMRYHGLLDGVPDFSEKVDDPIATALRHAQDELRKVVATNKARKRRLADIARDRLGYQEYLELRDSIDRNITNAYIKLQKKDGPKLSKKKKKVSDAAAAAAGEPIVPAPLPPCPAALGLGPDPENHLVVSEQLQQLVETRRQWTETVGEVFEEKQREFPGRIYGLPKESIYQGVEEEANAELMGLSTSTTAAAGVQDPDHQRTSIGKGKERANDAMDVS